MWSLQTLRCVVEIVYTSHVHDPIPPNGNRKSGKIGKIEEVCIKLPEITL